jgi:hypothetical protein
MPSFLMFENGMGLTVDEDVDTVRSEAASSSDGFAELHAKEKKVIVRIDAVKYAQEEATANGAGGIGFKTSAAKEG